MNLIVEYRSWQPGDDDAVAPLLLGENLVPSEDYYRNKFEIYPELEPAGIWLANADGRVIGHALGRAGRFFVEDQLQTFGLVEMVVVTPEMRRQGIGFRLMKHLLAYFEEAGYRGSLLSTDSVPAYKMYQKLGYHQLTARAHTLLPPSETNPTLQWTAAELSNLETLRFIREQWAKRTFPVQWEIEDVHRFNLRGYHVLRRNRQIVGYVQWIGPSNRWPHGKISDPIVSNESPIAVIESVRGMISVPMMWQTCTGSRYERALRELGCTIEFSRQVWMLRSFGIAVELSGMYRNFI